MITNNRYFQLYTFHDDIGQECAVYVCDITLVLHYNYIKDMHKWELHREYQYDTFCVGNFIEAIHHHILRKQLELLKLSSMSNA